MQEHQRGHVVDDAGGVAQGAQPLAGHLGPDDLVMVKAHPAGGLVPAGGRLADVVQQRRQPQHQVRLAVLQRDRLLEHRQRMGVDVLVLVVLIDLQAHRGHLGQHVLGQPGVHHQLNAGPRIGPE